MSTQNRGSSMISSTISESLTLAAAAVEAEAEEDDEEEIAEAAAAAEEVAKVKGGRVAATKTRFGFCGRTIWDNRSTSDAITKKNQTLERGNESKVGNEGGLDFFM
ncbi:unnamed protein product [Linum trigynum]|uniref:Uncharacterized protein n=1 Tax=Linum trigynum TaxID=586398 RepID=A0AAV2EQ40_9ROSI